MKVTPDSLCAHPPPAGFRASVLPCDAILLPGAHPPAGGSSACRGLVCQPGAHLPARGSSASSPIPVAGEQLPVSHPYGCFVLQVRLWRVGAVHWSLKVDSAQVHRDTARSSSLVHGDTARSSQPGARGLCEVPKRPSSESCWGGCECVFCGRSFGCASRSVSGGDGCPVQWLYSVLLWPRGSVLPCVCLTQ